MTGEETASSLINRLTMFYLEKYPKMKVVQRPAKLPLIFKGSKGEKDYGFSREAVLQSELSSIWILVYHVDDDWQYFHRIWEIDDSPAFILIYWGSH